MLPEKLSDYGLLQISIFPGFMPLPKIPSGETLISTCR